MNTDTQLVWYDSCLSDLVCIIIGFSHWLFWSQSVHTTDCCKEILVPTQSVPRIEGGHGKAPHGTCKGEEKEDVEAFFPTWCFRCSEMQEMEPIWLRSYTIVRDSRILLQVLLMSWLCSSSTSDRLPRSVPRFQNVCGRVQLATPLNSPPQLCWLDLPRCNSLFFSKKAVLLLPGLFVGQLDRPFWTGDGSGWLGGFRVAFDLRCPSLVARMVRSPYADVWLGSKQIAPMLSLHGDVLRLWMEHLTGHHMLLQSALMSVCN